jgi:hypothetical protein
MVPNCNLTGAIITLGDFAFEPQKRQIVIPNLDAQPLDPGLLREAFRHGPTLEHAVLFKTEIEMMRASVMFLDYESGHIHRILLADGFHVSLVCGGML